MDLLCNYVSLISTAYRLTTYRKSNTVDLQVTALSCPIHLIKMHFPEDETLVVDTDDIPERGLDSDDENKRARFKCWPVFGRVNPDLLVCKAFYFLFYGAYGSLFPLLAVYFKQLGLSPFEIGILIGIRPFVEFCAAPVWGGLADTYKKAKFILLLSLFSWLVFTEAMAFVQPEKPTCIEYDRMYNDALLQPLPLQPPQQLEDDVGQQTDFNRPADQLDIQKEDSGDDDDDKKPSHYNMKYTRKTFLTLLFLVIVGEFFCSPTHTLTDSATLSYLGREKMKYYGRQRMFGSLGWGISMLAMGVLLDRTSVTRQGCETEGEVVTRNYFICFGSFAVLITAAFVVATQIRFRYHGTDDSTTELSELKQPKLPGVAIPPNWLIRTTGHFTKRHPKIIPVLLLPMEARQTA
ncbi:putative major facilitator superfamily domain-containing protein 6 [Apostichopus japonicus]|uniref:Putative major facilitator superfamily domain-containing protein 6 n=1 Tax=Stichopus japonicus TaxID=307972 RepID=A0A2G8KDK3_STIJA|nr:putative major facilitator superfamily domain-containing protein 6 [Apostichopus japonicus]